MAQPWQVVDRVSGEGGVLELRRRGERDFLITVDGRVLMTSSAHRSETALGDLACRGLARRVRPRVLVGGLGMGFTLRAVLAALPASGAVLVAELNPQVTAWCRGPLAPLTGGAVDDPRVTVAAADVADVIRGAPPGGLDAVILDLYEGPHGGSRRAEDPVYGALAIERTRSALASGGRFAVWGENHDPGFEKRLRAAGFTVTCERPGRGGLRHVVYVATAGASRPKGRPRRT